MLQIANAFFKLPGDYLHPGEDESDGLKKRLDHILTPQMGGSDSFVMGGGNGSGGDWEVGDCLTTWYRPNFETYMVSDGLFDCRQ